MIDLSKYRIIDLTLELVPGERKIDGHYLHGQPLMGRPIEVQEYIAYEARMHTIQGHTHAGTHVEAPYKYLQDGADLAAMPVECYLGEAVVCDFSGKKPEEAITGDDFRKAGVKSGDIVLAWASADTASSPPYTTFEAIDWLIETKIKMLALENIRYLLPGTQPAGKDADYKLLVNGIVTLDFIHGLHQIKKPRVFFIALPLKMRRVTACPTRAIALEELDWPVSQEDTDGDR